MKVKVHESLLTCWYVFG